MALCVLHSICTLLCHVNHFMYTAKYNAMLSAISTSSLPSPTCRLHFCALGHAMHAAWHVDAMSVQAHDASSAVVSMHRHLSLIACIHCATLTKLAHHPYVACYYVCMQVQLCVRDLT